MNASGKNKKDKWIAIYFVLFFLVIFCVNAVFVYVALNTHTGVITEQPYEKGLAYNETLAAAKAQPQWQGQITYENGILRWSLNDENSVPITDAIVTAHFIRSVQDGYDFDMDLPSVENGLYECKPDFPLHGQWQVKLSATWNNKTYSHSQTLTVQ